MTLEEKITFYSHEAAVDFQKFLREKECGSRIVVEHSFSGEPYFEGTISQFMNLIDLLAKKDEEENEVDEDLLHMKNDLIERKETLEEFLEGHKEGDLLSDSTPSQMLAQLQTIDATGDDAIKKDAADKFVSSLMVLATLEDNGLLEEEGENYRLKEIKAADEMTVMYAYNDFPAVTQDDLAECGIASHVRTSSTTDYVITVGTEVLFVNTDEIADFLDHVDVDEEEAAKFVDAVFFKQAFVGKIHELVAEGNASEEALLEALGAPSFPLEGTNDVISFDITADYLKAVVNDLRKLGILTGKDGKIKNT
ncbi:MAG TPA: hypothetical protein O0X61_05760 [Methanocorpusculum sp.]|nr:hypothetical protein [Methanocorpusculum parvum]HJJ74967.1 hypothetical protein [Methanocorpusculum sp.]HJJ84049.1 hypothetical protein [Methanocorpusculum sp.]